jgi:exodeoxyribonuclease VIII
MMDHWDFDQMLILDLKKVANAHPLQVSRNIVQLGHDLQYAAYTRAISALNPEMRGKVEMHFLWCETEPPYAVVPAVLDGAFREIGNLRWRRAVELWEKCLKTQYWPSYTDRLTTLEPPPWVLTQELGSEQ